MEPFDLSSEDELSLNFKILSGDLEELFPPRKLDG